MNHINCIEKKGRLRAKNFILTWPLCYVHYLEIKERLEKIVEDKLVYMIISSEEHADGKPHRHAFLSLSEVINANKFTFDIPVEGGLKVCHGNYQAAKSPRNAIKYVKKDGNFKEWGVCPYKEKMSTAERSKMFLCEDLNKLVEKGELSLFHYERVFKAKNHYNVSCNANKPRVPPSVYWLWGPTGSGKTRYAVSVCEDYWISSDTRWFDGYRGQKVAILDDLRASSYEFSILLRLLDRYPFNAPIKGGFVVWEPEIILHTRN